MKLYAELAANESNISGTRSTSKGNRSFGDDENNASTVNSSSETISRRGPSSSSSPLSSTAPLSASHLLRTQSSQDDRRQTSIASQSSASSLPVSSSTTARTSSSTMENRRQRPLLMFQCLATVLMLTSIIQLLVGHYLHYGDLNPHHGLSSNENSPLFKSLEQFVLSSSLRTNDIGSSSTSAKKPIIRDEFTNPDMMMQRKIEERQQKPLLRKESLNNVKQVRLSDPNDLTSLTNDNPDVNGDDNDDKSNYILNVLKNADIEITDDLRNNLPSYKNFTAMYGPEPVIVGLEHCQAFRDAVPAEERLIGPVGMFNTGTNLLYTSLNDNCKIVERMKKYGKRSKGMQWQAPWGKHSPLDYRFKHFAQHSGHVDPNNFMPVSIIKDPYTWMTSMCRHPYAANWKHDRKQHCPNLLPNEVDYNRFSGELPDDVESKGIPVKIHFNPNITHYENLADVWNTWYGHYVESTHEKHGPRLMIRFEDLLLHAETIIPKVCSCVGGVPVDDSGRYRYTVESAKSGAAHHGSSGLLDAILRYIDPVKRLESYTFQDLQFANKYLNQTMLDLFHYTKPSMSSLQPVTTRRKRRR